MTRLCTLLLLSAALARADAGTSDGGKEAAQYRLFPHDLVSFAVQGESDVSADRKVDATGSIDVPLLGSVKVSGLTIGEAQDLIAKRYIGAEIYIHPQVVLSIKEYVKREMTVLGQVDKPGTVQFPAEATHMSITEAIAAAGGFTRLANARAVKITRKNDKGEDETETFNVQKAMEGHSTDDSQSFDVIPGDLIFVPERVF